MEDAEETGVSLVSSAGKCPFADASSFFCVFDFAIKDLCKASSRAAYPPGRGEHILAIAIGFKRKIAGKSTADFAISGAAFCHDN
jgi:hypothetical protein